MCVLQKVLGAAVLFPVADVSRLDQVVIHWEHLGPVLKNEPPHPCFSSVNICSVLV